MRSSAFIISASLATLAFAKTDLTGCTSTDVSSPAGASVAWYVPGTGEICEALDCGGGRAPPKTTVPGCPLYSGPASYSPSFLAGYTTATAIATAGETTAAGAVVSALPYTSGAPSATWAVTTSAPDASWTTSALNGATWSDSWASHGGSWSSNAAGWPSSAAYNGTATGAWNGTKPTSTPSHTSSLNAGPTSFVGVAAGAMVGLAAIVVAL